MKTSSLSAWWRRHGGKVADTRDKQRSDRLAGDRRRSCARSRLQPIALEELENRVLLSITPEISGSTVKFSDTAPNDQLTLRVDQGNLKYSTDGTNFSADLDLTTPGMQSKLVASLTSISVNLSGGHETLLLEDSLTTALLTGTTTLLDTGGPSDTVATTGSNDHTWMLYSATSVTSATTSTPWDRQPHRRRGRRRLVHRAPPGAYHPTAVAAAMTLDYSAYATGGGRDLARHGDRRRQRRQIAIVDGGSGNDSFTAGSHETFNGGAATTPITSIRQQGRERYGHRNSGTDAVSTPSTSPRHGALTVTFQHQPAISTPETSS